MRSHADSGSFRADDSIYSRSLNIHELPPHCLLSARVVRSERWRRHVAAGNFSTVTTIAAGNGTSIAMGTGSIHGDKSWQLGQPNRGTW